MTETKSRPEFWWRWRQKRWFRWTVDILVVVLIFAVISTFQTWRHLSSGEPVPEFALTTLDGERFTSDMLEGKPSVLFFWAPWCGVCKADAHNIADVREALGDQVTIVSIALSYSEVSEVQEFVDENGVTGPVLLGHRATADSFEIDSFPTVYILDSSSRVKTSLVGYTTEFGLRARLALQGVF